MSIVLKDFCQFDIERNCYVISNDYNMYLYWLGDAVEWNKCSDKDNSRSEEDIMRIEFAYIGAQVVSYELDAYFESKNIFSPHDEDRWLDLALKIARDNNCDDPVFKKIISEESPRLQNITLGQFMTDKEIQIELKNNFEIGKKEFLENYPDLPMKVQAAMFMRFSAPNTYTFYEDLRRKLRYREGLYMNSNAYDIEIQAKDKTYYIASDQYNLYNELYPLFTEGIIKNPCDYSSTFNGRMDLELSADQHEANIRDCINDFNRMMDEEGGWENID